MRGNQYFWSLVLIVIGVMLLLGNLGLLPANAWALIWPSLLIIAGLWVLSGRFFRRSAPMQSVDIPLEGAQKARVILSHGAGRVDVSGLASPGLLLSGRFGGGVVYKLKRSADLVVVDLQSDVGRGFELPFPWFWGPGSIFDWSFSLSGDVPLELEVKTGASGLRLDLSQLRLTDLKLETGASSSEITLPERAGMTRVSVRGGATSVKLRVPEGVAARITSESGLADVSVNTARFPRTAAGYESTNFANAVNKVEIRAEVGLGSVSIA